MGPTSHLKDWTPLEEPEFFLAYFPFGFISILTWRYQQSISKISMMQNPPLPNSPSGTPPLRSPCLMSGPFQWGRVQSDQTSFSGSATLCLSYHRQILSTCCKSTPLAHISVYYNVWTFWAIIGQRYIFMQDTLPLSVCIIHNRRTQDTRRK